MRSQLQHLQMRTRKEKQEEDKVEFVKPKSHKKLTICRRARYEPFEEGMQLKDKVAAIEEFQAK